MSENQQQRALKGLMQRLPAIGERIEAGNPDTHCIDRNTLIRILLIVASDDMQAEITRLLESSSKRAAASDSGDGA
jgi:hypothetical protein